MSKKAETLNVPCENCGKLIQITKRTKIGKATCMDSDPPRQELIIDSCPHCANGGAVVAADNHPLLRWLFDNGKSNSGS